MENKSILIMDDDPDLLRSLQIILEDRDFIVYTATNKDEGIKLLKEKKPDLLIQDLMMESYLEGFGIINDLKQDPSFSALPIIMLTGMTATLEVNFRSAVEDPEKYPNVVFMDKPVEPDVLITEINALLK